MRYVPTKEKKAWHQKAKQATENSDLSDQLDLWVEEKARDRLAARLRKAADSELEALSHYRTAPLARQLARTHPDSAGRIYRALCMRIVNAGKAGTTMQNLRKKGFMFGFEDIVAGAPTHVESPFLGRANARWPKKSKGDRHLK